MRIFFATMAAALFMIAGQMPASAATTGPSLLQKPSYGQPNSSVEKAGWGHRRHYRGYRGWRHRHHRRWWW